MNLMDPITKLSAEFENEDDLIEKSELDVENGIVNTYVWTAPLTDRNPDQKMGLGFLKIDRHKVELFKSHLADDEPCFSIGTRDLLYPCQGLPSMPTVSEYQKCQSHIRFVSRARLTFALLNLVV